MRKSVALVVLGSFVLGGVVASEVDALAAADPLELTLDCTNDAALVASLADETWPGEANVINALVGDDVKITVSGSGDCTVRNLSGLEALDITGEVTVEDGTTTAADELDVDNSGAFQIKAVGGNYRTVYVDACSLPGSGIMAADPSLVGSLDDLAKVGAESSTPGEESCSLAGKYLQTANISGVDTNSTPALIVAGTFSGTYDGNHYGISYTSGSTFQDREPLFEELSGTVQKLSLTGTIRSDTTRVSSLVEYLVGGTISEVGSSVQIYVADSDAIIGGLAAVAGDNMDSDEMYGTFDGTDDIENQSSYIRYSKFTGRLEWDDTSTVTEGPIIGGLVGSARGTGTTEIRDSYARANIRFDSSGLTSAINDTAVLAGGLVGSDGLTVVGDGDGDTSDSDSRSSAASNVRLVRTYAAGSFTNFCSGTAVECNTDTPSHVFTGGLIGFSEDMDDSNDLQVASYWLSSSATNPVGLIADSGNQPSDYTAATPGLPEAPGLSSTLLRTVTTYQSEEEGTTDLPSGDADLTVADSTGTLAEQDYRWAIENGNIQTFVGSDYDTVSNYLTRNVYGDTSVAQTYRREGAGDLSAHGGEDPESVTGYPSLGRVWEICTYANDGYPVLVWEEEDCAAPGGGSSERSQAAEARSLGFTEEEYLRFLDSGLTWEQFTLQLQAEQSAALASTGLSAQRMALGSAVALGLLLGGAALLLPRVRRGSRAPSS